MSDYPHFSELIRLRDWIQKHSVSEAALVEMIEGRSVELFAHVRSTELIEIDDCREERSLGLEVENRFMPVYPGAVVDALLDNVPLVGNFLETQNPIEHRDPNHDGTGQHFLCEPERIQVRDLYLSLTSIPSKPNANLSAATATATATAREIVTIENWQVVRFGTRKSKKLNEAQSQSYVSYIYAPTIHDDRVASGGRNRSWQQDFLTNF